MEDTYARALIKLIQAGLRPEDSVAKINAALKDKGRQAMWPRIKRAFLMHVQKVAMRENVTLSVACKEDVVDAKREAQNHLARNDADRMQMVVDDSLIGGWKLEAGGTLIDRSFKRQLKDMYKKIVQ